MGQKFESFVRTAERRNAYGLLELVLKRIESRFRLKPIADHNQTCVSARFSDRPARLRQGYRNDFPSRSLAKRSRQTTSQQAPQSQAISVTQNTWRIAVRKRTRINNQPKKRDQINPTNCLFTLRIASWIFELNFRERQATR